MAKTIFKLKGMHIQLVPGILFGLGIDHKFFAVFIGCVLIEFDFEKK